MGRPLASDAARDLLRLTLIKGLGPVRIARLVEAFGSARAVLGASPRDLATVRGIGDVMARRAAEGMRAADAAVDDELRKIADVGAHVVSIEDEGYPELLSQAPGAPPVLMVRGELRAKEDDRHPVAIVGSRSCTAYGVEQAERFAGVLARSGLTIVSGGARGIDAAAHRAAMRSGGRTIAVLGCGLAKCYPPEHAELYDAIADGRGAVISELPMDTPPDAQNFPARNRIISALSLGVLVIEAGEGSGALITARHAVEDHGREVMALPGRADSNASRGSLELIRDGAAALVTDPAHVIEQLERAARHQFQGTHAAVTADPARTPGGARESARPVQADPGLSGVQAAIVDALAEPRTLDQIARGTGIDAAAVRAEMTVLEVLGRVRRTGSQFERA
ncbi:MAG: DNA-processing protein DprA [Phycisphaerales bacterium]